MKTWDKLAEELLDAATSSGVQVARSVIAPGPEFARDCRMIAVHLQTASVRPLPSGPMGRRGAAVGLGGCATAPQLTYEVTFVSDCVPGPGDSGNPPPAEAITAWSLEFLADAGRIADALADACATLTDDCNDVTVGDTIMTGPSGGIATAAWPVTVLNT